MAKKKQKNNQQQFSPKKYIYTKARSLPIAESLMSDEWQETGMSWVTIARQHSSGNYTVGIYLIDSYCLGIKDSHYSFNISPDEYAILREKSCANNSPVAVSYEEAHNFIYGAMAYAEEYGLSPHPSFNLTQYILEEDDESIPLIEYEYGKNGKPFLVVYTQLEGSKYIPILKKTAGEGNFNFIIGNDNPEEDDDDDYDDYETIDDDDDYDDYYDEEDEDDDDEEEDDDEEIENDYINLLADILDSMEDRLMEDKLMVHTEYTYTHPAYPDKLTYHFKELDAFYEPDNCHHLPTSVISGILALPREELIADLQHILLYEMGRLCNGISKEEWDAPFLGVMMHALFFLGELRAEEALDTILQVMRQNSDFNDFYFSDSTDEILPLTLYFTGRNQLSQLFDYVKEPGLEPIMRIFVFTVPASIALNEPERREEVIEWFRTVLRFYIEQSTNSEVFDATLIGIMLIQLINIEAVELLPEIKELFQTGQVDKSCCGDYSDMIDEINIHFTRNLKEYDLKDIYERYKEYNENWS